MKYHIFLIIYCTLILEFLSVIKSVDNLDENEVNLSVNPNDVILTDSIYEKPINSIYDNLDTPTESNLKELTDQKEDPYLHPDANSHVVYSFEDSDHLQAKDESLTFNQSPDHSQNEDIDNLDSFRWKRDHDVVVVEEEASLLQTIEKLQAVIEEKSTQIKAQELIIQKLQSEGKTDPDSRSVCYKESVQLKEKIDSFTCNQSVEYQTCQNMLQICHDENQKAWNDVSVIKRTLLETEAVLISTQDHLSIYDAKLVICQNEKTSLTLQVENCGLEMKISKLEVKTLEHKYRHSNCTVYDNCSLSACTDHILGYFSWMSSNIQGISYHDYSQVSDLIYKDVKMIINKIMNMTKDIISTFWTYLVYLQTIAIPKIQWFSQSILVPGISNIRTRILPIISPTYNSVLIWYYANLSVYVEDYILPPFDFLYRGFHHVAYYTLSYYQSDDFPKRVWDGMTWFTNELLTRMNRITTEYEINRYVSVVFGKYADTVMVIIPAILSLYLLWRWRRYILGIGSLILMILLSPLLLFVYLFIEVPRRLFWLSRFKGTKGTKGTRGSKPKLIVQKEEKERIDQSTDKPIDDKSSRLKMKV